MSRPKVWGKKLEGRRVRLLRAVRIHSGDVYEKGTVLQFSHRTCYGLVLHELGSFSRVAIRGLEVSAVELLEEGVPDAK